MVWKKLFGGGREKEPSPREIERKRQFDRWLDGIGPEWAEAYMILVTDPALDQAFRAGVHYALNEGDVEEARKILRQSMHFLTPDSREKLRNVGQAQRWATFDQIAEAGIVISSNATFPMDALQIAKQPVPDRPDLEFPLYFRGEGHLLTVAPTGAGKGQRLILPVLLDFEGPTVVLDPKGENYEHTAWRRSLYGQVFKWAPGEADSDCYNPLDRVTGWGRGTASGRAAGHSSGQGAFLGRGRARPADRIDLLRHPHAAGRPAQHARGLPPADTEQGGFRGDGRRPARL
ncbi:hypothetical protein BOQ54_04475 [Chelatococcus daeguensis]|uniref:Type IV secretory system Conjugative DNA transfer n=1 Tax=Chelatococcus daeguensis TaxID=444444 RepID=A0AAC9NY60_9HYPH|nr:hypothetical protein BOQ54_04475 [Chelatococcus daeguensis]